MNELNKKLAEWRWSGVEISANTLSQTSIKVFLPHEVNEEVDFTQSLDACCKWLVKDTWCVYFFIEGICLIVDTETSKSYLGVHSIKATALCKAIERLIENE